MPNSIVENLAFKDLLRTADLSRTAVSKELESVYIKLRAKMDCFIQEANKISFTADLWSKKGLSGHNRALFLWKDHRNHCVTLAVRHLPPIHTAVNICAIVEEVLSEWEIPHTKVSAILTDNGSNVVAAFRFDKAVMLRDCEDDESDMDEEEDDELDFDTPRSSDLAALLILSNSYCTNLTRWLPSRMPLNVHIDL